MAFPVVESITQTNSNSGTTKTVNLPATVDSGDKLLLTFASTATQDNVTATSDLDDWDLVLSHPIFLPSATGGNGLRIYVLDADGTEGGGSVDFTVSGGLISTAQVYRISGAEPGAVGVGWDFALFPATGVAQSFGRNLDPPNVTATWGSDDNLFVCGFFAGATGPGTTTGNPTNYTAGATTAGPLAGAYWQGTAWRQLAAASDNPGTFEINGPAGDQENYRAWTIVFQPVQTAPINIVPVRANATARVRPTSDIVLAAAPINIVPVRANARARVQPTSPISQPLLPTRLEAAFMLNGIWVDAVESGGVFTRDEVSVTYGRANWSSLVDASRASLSLDNRDGRWSPDLDTALHAGIWKRNIPVRIGVGGNFNKYLGRSFLIANKNMMGTPDDASLDVADSIDLRFEYELEEDVIESVGGSDETLILADKIDVPDEEGFQWQLRRDPTLRMIFFWYIPVVGLESVTVNLPNSIQHDRQALRVTMNATTGFVTFYSGPDADAGPWTVIDAPVDSGAGANSIAGSDRDLSVGSINAPGIKPFPGKIYRFQMRDGIDGTVVADADLRNQPVGTAGFTDEPGRVWTVEPGGRITDMRWRFHGELASIPVRWDTQGNDVWAPIEAAGLFRRLRQGQRSLQSAIRRSIVRGAPSNTTHIQYWPCEESGDNVTAFGAAIGVAALVISNGAPEPAASSAHISSEPLPKINAATWTATVDDYVDTFTQWFLRFNLLIPSDPLPATLDPIIRIVTDEGRWDLTYDSTQPDGGDLTWEIYNTGGVIQTSATFDLDTAGGLDTPLRMRIAVQQIGPNISFTWNSQIQGALSNIVLQSGNLPVALNTGTVEQVIVNPNGVAMGIVMGQIELLSNDAAPLSTVEQINGHVNEPAGERIQRLCEEEGIRYRMRGEPTDTELMGVQRPRTIMELLQECADTDLGILHEPRETIAVAYRTRATLIGQTNGIGLDYLEGHITSPPELDRDDQSFSNDISLENLGGGSARAELNDGTDLSVSEPPVGAGRYDSSFSMNGLDSRLPVLAQARLALSTVDEPRVSRLRVSPHYPAYRNNPPLMLRLLEAPLGHLIELTNNLPVALGSKLIRQLIQGTKDSITPRTHDIDILGSPALPWDDLNVSDPVTPDPPPDPDPPPAENGTPAPTIPTFNALTATTVGNGESLADACANGSPGDHFFVENGAVCINVNPQSNQHIRFAGNFVGEGAGVGYFIRPASQGVTGVVIGGDPNALTRPIIRNYGTGTSSQEYGAILGRVDDALNSLPAPSFVYQDVDDWLIYGLELATNSSIGIKLGSNWTVYDCVIWGHTVNAINGDRIVGGLLHSCHFWFNALNPATGGASNGANVKMTWLNGDIGRTVTTPIDRAKADFIVSNCTFDALDQRLSPVAGDTNIGMWFDLDCQQFLVEYCEFNDHPNTSIFAEGSNNGRFTQNTVRRSNGFGSGVGTNFSNAAISTGESTNIEVDNNTLVDCNTALMNRLSGRTDWLDPGSPQNYAYNLGPRFWLLATTAIPAVSGQSNIYTGDNNYHDNVLDNCDRVIINEGINNAFQTVVGITPLASILFSDNDYTLSPSIEFFEASLTSLNLAAWQALPRTRDQ